jgi:hypothetical protein
MTKEEYIKKREAYATSSASLEVREKAINELDKKFVKEQVKDEVIVETSDTKDMGD